MKRLKKLGKKGFSLLEMLVVIFIISLLLLLIIPNINKQRQNAEEQANQALVNTIQTQVELYRMDERSVPGSLEVLVNGGYLSAEQKSKADTAGITLAEDGTINYDSPNGQ